MADNIFDKEQKEQAESASYENEAATSRTVTIPLREYDTLKEQEHLFLSQLIKDPSLISIIDKIEELVRALRKHIIRK